MFFVYILECFDHTYYIGATTDIARRVDMHNRSKKGAKYTRSRRPVRLVYHEQYETLSAALKREHVLKKLSHAQKEELIRTSEKTQQGNQVNE